MPPPPRMDVSSDPPPFTYILWTLFTMPTRGGGVIGIAVPEKVGMYLVALYTLIITGIFGFCWQFVTYLILMFYPTEERPPKSQKMRQKDGTLPDSTLLLKEEEERLLEIRRRKANRYIALVSVWNSSDPWTAMLLLVEHAFMMFYTVKDRMTGTLDVVLLFLAAGVVICNGAAGILIPANLSMGNVAPVNSSNVFVWLGKPVGEQLIQLQTLKASAAQRAVGAVEAGKERLREKATLVVNEVPSTGLNGEKIQVQQLTYKYSVTGVDFGLQHASELLHSVEGVCTLEYGWLSQADQNWDIYNIPFRPNNPKHILTTRDPKLNAGTTVYMLNEFPVPDPAKGITRYAVIYDTVGRQSYSTGTDPMYSTAPINSTTLTSKSPGYEVRRGRPALSCSQKNTWAYKGKSTNETIKLGDIISDKDLPTVLVYHIVSRLDSPKIIDLSNAFGTSVLISSMASVSGAFDAASANWVDDMERLILASFVSTRDIFRDAALTPNHYRLINSGIADPATGILEPGLGDFVMSSREVTTLSLAVLISIPCLWLLVWVFISAFRCARHTHRNSGKASRFSLRAVGLQAVQMYRLMDEEVCGYRDDWSGRKGHIPYILSARAPPKMDSLAPGIFERPPMDPMSRDLPVFRPNLFAAPKVLKGQDNRYHLKFTGPLNYEAKKDESQITWTWQEGKSESVANGPKSESMTDEPMAEPTAGEGQYFMNKVGSVGVESSI